MIEEKGNGQHPSTAMHEVDLSRYDALQPRGSSWLAWVVTIIIVVVAGVGAFVMYRRDAAAEQAAGPGGKGHGPMAVQVVTAVARKGDLPIYLTGLGIVTPLNTVTVRTRVDGQIEQVAYTEGQEVKKGELLVQIDPRPFQAQFDSAKGQQDKDQATLANAQRDLKRYQDLVKTQAVTQQQVDTQQSLVQQTQGIVDTDKAQVESAQLNLIYAHITAPFDGRIGLRLVDPGNIVHATDTIGLAVITQLKPITLVFTLPEDNIPQIQAAMKVKKDLEVDAFSRDLLHKLSTGSLLAIDNQVDPSTGTLKLKAQFSNEDQTLYPQQFVNARLLVDVKRNTVLVPIAALQRSPDSTFVYVVDQEKKVHIHTVKPGPSEGETASVLEGISAGDVVVTDGVDKLTEGASVSPHAATTRPSGVSSQPNADSSSSSGSTGDAIGSAGAHHGHRGDGAGGASDATTRPASTRPGNE